MMLGSTSIMSVIIFLVAFLTLMQQPAEGRQCRHPRPLRHGRYEYQRSSDNVDASLLPEGYVVRVICRPHARRFGDEYIVCQENGKWSSRVFCRGAVICRSSPPVPENGYVRMRGRSSGSIALYGCNPGFLMVGRSTTSCDVSTSAWQEEAPTCIRPPSCPVPTDLPERMTSTLRTGTGQLIDALYTEQSVLRYSCVDGYFPSSDVNITCQSGGAWISDGEVPECNEILCRPPTLELIAFGTSNIVDRDYEIGEEVHYTCDLGYRVDGKSWQVCREGDGPIGVWTERVPGCRVVQCPDPGQLHLGNDGHVSFSSPDRRLGTVMNLRCSSRLTLLGSSERVCQPNGLWNGTLTSCDSEENYCLALGNPIHGTKVVPYSFNLNSVVRFRCNTGTNDNGDPLFELVGSHERRCTVTREWSGEMPRCMARDEFDDMDTVTAVMGETFDELEIDGNYLSRQRDNDSLISSTSRRKRSIDLNSERGLDIIFAFDASGSIGNESFSKGKEFAKLLVKKVFVSLNPGGARVGVLVYATEAEIIFHVNEYSDTESVVHAIETRVQHKNKGTNLPLALDLIKREMLPIAQTGPNTNKRVLFILTDGLNNMGGEPLKDAQRLKDRDEVTIHCIGVSQDVSKKSLNSIASEPKGEHIFLLRDYWDLEHAVNQVTQTNRSYDQCGKAGLVSATLGTVRRGRWPWQAAIYAINPNIENDEGKFGCGGSLIHKEWVLTAAHCLQNVTTESELAIYLGLTTRSEDLLSGRYQRIDVAQIVIHPEYHHDGSYFNDIALLRLEHAAQLNKDVRTICLPPDLDLEPNRARTLLRPNSMARVIGWGHPNQVSRGSNAELAYSNTLKEIVLPLVKGKTCKDLMDDQPGIGEINTAIQLCAGTFNGGNDACKGDSGGPLMVEQNQKFVVVGIVSFGAGCGQSGTYGVYTKVPSYVEWIQNITGITP